MQEARDRVGREWGRGLLDIHGQGAQDEAIYRGTGNGKTVVSLTQRFGTEAIRTEKHIQPMGLMGYRVLPYHRVLQRRAICGWLYRSNLRQPSWPRGIDAIQLEIGTKFRARANLEQTATDLAEAIAVFAQTYLPLVKSPAFKAMSPP